MDTSKFFWQEKQADGVKVGLNDLAREELGKIKFVNLPKLNTKVEVGAHLFDLEAEKAVLDIDSPLSGEIIAANETLSDNPEALDSQDKSKNWLFIIK